MSSIATPQEVIGQSSADLLRAALAELRRPIGDRNGWQQGAYGSANGCKCAAGAIWAAAGRLNGYDSLDGTPQTEAAFRLLATAAGCDPSSVIDPESQVISWNDRRIRTFPEVEAAFERAIELAEAGAR
ncbi:hypothetical protein [Mycobacteroides chelonae]|uniref:DUF6197 family protein n=1 Tax=Mycobacteroides chelonae TaxID=1774 RepID=UPI0008A880BE|nr:hypothetical protein [Mycobacteroides chelonae]OHU39517.1 hypothetical protein BKG78_11650 [Mycobacteroides chelonae]